jgi:hypothetical protein
MARAVGDPMRGDLRPHVTLLKPVLPGAAHQRAAQEKSQLTAVILASLREVAKEMMAVGVEQCVSDTHGLSAAERVDLRLVAGLGPPTDRALSRPSSHHLFQESGGLLILAGGGKDAQPPRSTFADEPPGGDGLGVFGFKQQWPQVRDGHLFSGLPAVAPQVHLTPSAADVLAAHQRVHSRSSLIS